jgi:anti-anti-sigma factor
LTEPTRLPLAVELVAGNAPGTVIFRFNGPFTARAVFAAQSPEAFDKMFALEPAAPATTHIFDLTQVPYMDSAGLGMVVRHYTRCQSNGVRFVAAGATPRVLELLKVTRVNTVLPLAASLAEADTP